MAELTAAWEQTYGDLQTAWKDGKQQGKLPSRSDLYLLGEAEIGGLQA